jgi:hypothetical protein
VQMQRRCNEQKPQENATIISLGMDGKKNY